MTAENVIFDIIRVNNIAIKNLKLVKRQIEFLDKDHSFEYDALVEKNWLRFGPIVFSDRSFARHGIKTIGIGWEDLEKAFIKYNALSKTRSSASLHPKRFERQSELTESLSAEKVDPRG